MDSIIANIRMTNIHKLHLLNGGGGGDCIDRYIK